MVRARSVFPVDTADSKKSYEECQLFALYLQIRTRVGFAELKT